MIRSAASFAREFLGNESHAWLLLMLGLLYGALAVLMAYQQNRTGIAPDIAVLKEVGATLVWWGGIVATGSTAKKMTSMIKGDSAGQQPVPPLNPAPGPADAVGAPGAM